MNEIATQGLDIVKILDVFFTALVGIAGLYLAHSYRRQQALRVGEKRLGAYQALWDRMEDATPVRQTKWKAEPLTKRERKKLFDDFTDWYYENGNGLFMGDNTRAIYLTAKDNLICDLRYYEPPSIRGKLCALPPKKQAEARGYLSIRQLSLLRNRMKADLGVFGIPYHVSLNELDEEFLIACGEDLDKKPWKDNKPQEDQTRKEIQIFDQVT